MVRGPLSTGGETCRATRGTSSQRSVRQLPSDSQAPRGLRERRLHPSPALRERGRGAGLRPGIARGPRWARTGAPFPPPAPRPPRGSRTAPGWPRTAGWGSHPLPAALPPAGRVPHGAGCPSVLPGARAPVGGDGAKTGGEASNSEGQRVSRGRVLDRGALGIPILFADMPFVPLPEHHRIEDILDPESPTNSTTTAFVSKSSLQQLRAHDPWKFFNSHVARDVLRNPEAICYGIRLSVENELKGWCYLGRPRLLRSTSNKERPLPEGFVFVAFVNSEMCLFDWGIERCDPASPYLPHDHTDRFLGETTWINQN